MIEMDITERLRLLVPIVTEEQRQSAHEAMRLAASEIDRLRAERDQLREALARMGDIIDARSELFASDEELLLNLKDTVNMTLKETSHG